MRPIDADALIEFCAERWIPLNIDAVNMQPTIEPSTNCSEIPNNSDTVSRQAAIDALNEYFARIGKLKRRGLTEGEKAISLDTVGAIKTLPPAQPEPQEGHWIDKGWNGDWAWQIDGRGNCWRVIECSECGKSVLVESNFCPHCGADMRKDGAE